MEGVRIIKLDSPLTVTSFEDAFGEFSEARGRGRARRKQRRLERIANRKEVRSARATARIANRAERQAARQEKRTANMEMRQQRRTARKTLKEERRAIGQEPEQAMDQQTAMEMAQPTNEAPVNASEPTATTGGTGYANEPNATTGDTGGNYGVGEDQPTGQEEDAGQGESETTEDSDVSSAEEQAAEEGEYFDGFDGGNTEGINYENLGDTSDLYALQDDDFYSYVSEFANADGTPSRVRARIGRNVKDAAMKSEWNKEMVTRLESKIANLRSKLENSNLDDDRRADIIDEIGELSQKVAMHKSRAIGFDGNLSDYMNADGEYSEARGKKSNNASKRGQSRRARNAERRRRKAEVRAAKKAARKARAATRRANRMAKRSERRYKSVTEVEQGVTPVERELKPEFSKNKIEIPAEDLNYNASGIIALDEDSDFDAPRTSTFEIKSGADGAKNVNWKGVFIGVAIAGLAIWGAKKAKLF